MTLFLYREKPSEKHRDGKQVSSLRATTRIEGRQAFIAIVRALKASQALGKAALAGRGEIPARLCYQPPDEPLFFITYKPERIFYCMPLTGKGNEDD